MSTMLQHLKMGEVVAGRFRIESIIGEGGMGTVYLARHITLPREYAIKVLKTDFCADDSYVERFRREAIAASRVVHPNVVYITDFGKFDNGSFYIVMEHLNGIGMDEVLDSSGAQPLSRILPILIQLADALDYAGSLGIVHRDLKPENIMLCTVRGHKDVVKLVDFGIAKLLEGQYANVRITMQGQIFGTPEYISPEQAMDAKIDARSDIYSLGVMAYELATGSPPFDGPPAMILRKHVQDQPDAPSSRMPRQLIPPGFDGIVLRCLAKKPDDRYQTARALCRDLQKLRGQLAGMADDLVGQRRTPTRAHMRVTTRGEWGTLSDFSEPMINVLDDGPEDFRALENDSGSGSAMQLAASSRDLREDLHATLKEVAFLLSETAIRSTELSEVLSQLLRIEEEGKALVGKIAVLEQNFERIRFEYGEQETMLRYALIDLRLLHSRILERCQGAPTGGDKVQADDLNYQIAALQRRLEEVKTEKGEKTRTLAEDVQKYRQAKADREEESAGCYTELHAVVEGVRDQAKSGTLPALYTKLDDLSEKLQLTRQSVRFLKRQ
ncbi:MAG: protein kinase [bacterium]